jgi:hypothetical protein
MSGVAANDRWSLQKPRHTCSGNFARWQHDMCHVWRQHCKAEGAGKEVRVFGGGVLGNALIIISPSKCPLPPQKILYSISTGIGPE